MLAVCARRCFLRNTIESEKENIESEKSYRGDWKLSVFS